MEQPDGVDEAAGGPLRRRWQFLLLAWLVALSTSAWAQTWDLRICSQPNSLPYSNREGEGFENLIAEVLADELGARTVHIWLPRDDARAREVLLRRGECDLTMGINDGHPGFLTTLAYYRSNYVFVYRSDSPFEISSFDDQVLRELRIGVQVGRGGVSPVTVALANRDLLQQQVGLAPDRERDQPLGHLVAAVASAEVDVAIEWGPIAGFFVHRHTESLELVPVEPEIEPPFVPMVASIAIGVRPGDEALRDSLNIAIASAWHEIQAILAAYRVPLKPLPTPTLGAAE